MLSVAPRALRPGNAPTGVIRAAGLALTKVLAGEGAPYNILVNALMVGSIVSDQIARRHQASGGEKTFEDMVAEVSNLLAMKGPQDQALVLPAYDQVLKSSHLFNLMDARGAIAVAERQSYIGRIRDLTKACAQAWIEGPGA